MELNKKLDETVLNKLRVRTIYLIRENHKTKKLTNSELNKKIRKMIEVAVNNEA